MFVARHILHCGRRPNADSAFEIEFADFEIGTGYCQLQIRVTRRDGFGGIAFDWGDGTVETVTGGLAWHNYTKVGRYAVRVGPEAKWWRLWDCYRVDVTRRVRTCRPQIFPRRWGDFLESAEGTYCGWTDPTHGGVQGEVIPWGKSLKSVFCCWQFCRDLRGGFPGWTDCIEDATGAFDGCTGLSGRVPKWGKSITNVTQTFCDCPGAYGRFPEWPRGCVEFGSCFKNATGMSGEIPEWPEPASVLNAAFEGATGAVGSIPAWPDGVTDVSRCYFGCAGLTGAWTEDPALLMPEEKVRYPGSDYYRCHDVVTGCAESLRRLFWDRDWGGTIPRPA